MKEQPAEMFDNLIIDDVETATFKVNRRVFTAAEILEVERKKVFDQCWLYVGHESEVPEPGSYISRKVAGRPMIFVRDADGAIQLFFDSCSHRGNSVCPNKSGKTERFLCFYHGWGFDTRGDLVVVPDPLGYGKKLDRSKLRLGSPPRIDSYRGLVFMSMKPDIVDLRTYLGGATEYIDMMLDMTESEAVVAPGRQSYSMKANWKLLLENSADIYHGMFTHMRFFSDYLTHMGVDLSSWRQITAQSESNKVITFDYGHSVVDTQVGPLPAFVDRPEVYERLRQGLIEKYGAERAARLMGRSQNLLIFPNLVMISAWRTIRTFYPVAPDLLECNGWAIIGKEDSPELREARFGNFIAFLGPAGFGTPDDVEALENCQRGFAATEVPWSDLSKGMARPGGSVANDELQQRNLWRRWYSLLNPDFVPGNETSSAMTRGAE